MCPLGRGLQCFCLLRRAWAHPGTHCMLIETWDMNSEGRKIFQRGNVCRVLPPTTFHSFVRGGEFLHFKKNGSLINFTWECPVRKHLQDLMWTSISAPLNDILLNSLCVLESTLLLSSPPTHMLKLQGRPRTDVKTYYKHQIIIAQGSYFCS